MIRIVFVEDDPIVLSNLRRVFSIMRREWDMRFFSSAEDALTFMTQRPFDVVVSDLSMPGMLGMELLALVQCRYPRAVRVLVSEPGEAEGVVRGSGVAHRILRKPCDPAELSAAIQRAFELEARLSDPDLQSIIAGVGSLPSPSRTVLALNDILGRDDPSVDEVASVVERDVALTARLLHVVNSAYFGLAKPMTNIREAVTYLGLDAVRNFSVAAEILKSFSECSPLVRDAVDELHEHAQAVACIARNLATTNTKRNEAFVAASLHDVGLLLLARSMPEKFLELRIRSMRDNLPLEDLEMEVIGARHADIGAHLLDLWGLPNEIVEAVARHHDAEGLPDHDADTAHLVRVAASIAGMVDEGHWEHDGDVEAEYLDRIGLAARVRALV